MEDDEAHSPTQNDLTICLEYWKGRSYDRDLVMPTSCMFDFN